MFEILCKDRSVGRAEVKQEGLYYRFSCICVPPDNGMYRICVHDGNTRRDLGICVPQGDKFVLNTRVPRKYLNAENLSFELTGEKTAAVSVPIHTGEPFDHLDKLETARLYVTDGQPEIVIASIQDPQDSGQNQEPQNRSEWQ